MEWHPAGTPYTPAREVFRKPVDHSWPTKDVDVQLMDIKQFTTPPVPGMPGPQNVRDVTAIRIFGATAEGHSASITVHGFQPYFWMQAPPGWQPYHTEPFRRMLNSRLESATGSSETIVALSAESKMSLLHFQNDELKPFLRITTHMPGHVPKARSLVEGKGPLGGGVEFQQLWVGQRQFMTYESNVLFELRYMVDAGVGGANWVTCPKGSYMPHFGEQKKTTSQIELTIPYTKLLARPAEDEWMRIAPLRILSFDIECQGRPGKFPEAEHDPVIQIAASVRVLGGQSSEDIHYVFCLDKTAPIPGVHVVCFETERDLLAAYADFHRAVDADVITGYNIVQFDFPYLLDRAETLHIASFPFLSRVAQLRTSMRTKVFQNKAHGKREFQEINVPGYVLVDLLVVVQREHKLRSYTLNNVSHHFLGEQKEDVHHSIIATLQMGDEETRNRLARYCHKDAMLPLKLLQKLMIVVNLVELARVTGVPMSWLIDKGQQIKVYSQILRKTLPENLLFPTVDAQSTEDSFQGATVIEPDRGFYDFPIATLDFASLYPSIMMAHNLCYSTLIVNTADIEKWGLKEGKDYGVTPSGDVFVMKDKKHGLLPRILQDLLTERKKAKKAMAETKDPFEAAVYNGRQLALKISANSVYGFTGTTVGKLPCFAISKSVTSFGRQMIDKTKEAVEKEYTTENGYPANAHVIYGDTDSVMINFGDKLTLEKAMELGLEAAEKVTKLFPPPVKLEFEKCYFPFLLMNKKRYAGLLWTNPKCHDKLDAKGIESVRRDNCPLVANLVSKVLKTILMERSVDKAVAYTKQVISDLLMNRLDVSHLVISKKLTMDHDEYAGRQAHAELAERMRKRDPGSAPSVGDRVPYVIIKAHRDAKAFEKSEDPLYVLEKNIPIDAQHYLQHQLKLPLMRLFEGIIPDPEGTLLKGAHTRKISVPVPQGGGMGLMRYAKVVLTCTGCKAKMGSGTSGPLCDSCKPNEAAIYARELAKRNYYGTLFSRVWAECQRCQGSLHEEVLCTNRDCSVFYMRKKVQKDLASSQKALDRFGSLEW
ncbi:DNA polymerase delta catalytic subunit [Diplonema papillatum]|nr:DNA polymerase delta catalytic subunit [Diplonema papillatum]KAJ9458485.1 DNA polymerase delta catalytic subunit [Diplonema papillatum]